MNVLILGSGGREHALAWAIAASPLLTKLWCAPGNAGISEIAECVGIGVDDNETILQFCRDHKVHFVVVGPEGPLVAGIVDVLAAAGIKAFGPSKAAAQLEGSKGFSKDFFTAFKIPTAAYGRFKNAEAARAYVAGQAMPIVVKADGLAAGKGVVIAESHAQADAAIDACFGGAFGAAGAEVVIEEFMEGEEASFFALVDGEHALALAAAQDHKRVGEGDVGPNTGGMGAYSPAPIMTTAMTERVMAEIIRPTVAGMSQRGTPYRGVLFAGLMITKTGPKLIEYNVRFGDPETQVILLRLKSDLLAALLATTNATLKSIDLQWRDEATVTVVYAAKGYPDKPQRGTQIKGLAAAAACPGAIVFHAGTLQRDGHVLANGGRVLNVTATGRTVGEAQKRAYAALGQIDWPGGFYRRDIGWRAIAREEQSK
jgi:phosphoribosylamine---glycine ligase